jgi:subtilase family serine protease
LVFYHMRNIKKNTISTFSLRIFFGLAWFALAGNVALATQKLQGHLPSAATNSPATGRLPATATLNFAISLPLRNDEALSQFLLEVNDPASPSYHQYLTPEEFTRRYGPAAEDYSRIIEFAQTNGFVVTTLHSNRTLVSLSGTVGDVERVFHVHLKTHRHPKENREFFAPDAEPELELEIPVLHISGLDDFDRPHPNLKKSPVVRATATPQAGTGPGGSFMGQDFRKAYVPGVALTGAGQTVALVQFDGYYLSDIQAYAARAGLTTLPLQNVYLDGFNGTPGADNDEVALDIEMVMSMAPGLSKLIVYQGGPNGFGDDILNRIAMDNSARQISASWTFGTSSATSQIFRQFIAQGQTYFNASGDSDAYTGAISKPADSPYVISVGGTTLTTSASGSWQSETVWNWGNGTGSGGGISTSYTMPSWQAGANVVAKGGLATRRNIPDVAMVADNIFVISSNGQQSYMGGTSCAAPLWAGFMALVNQQAAANGRPAAGFINPAVYTLGAGNSYPSCFHDIITGNNFSPTSPASFSAMPGYDLCTGWGSPAGVGLINALAPLAVAAPVRLAAATMAGTATFTFSFPTVAGHTYSVEYSDSPSGPIWTPLTTVTGTGTTQWITNSMTATQRFFRVRSS